MATHITVQLDDAFRARFVVWRRGLSMNPDDGKRLAEIYLEELCQRLIRSGGPPPGAHEELTATPMRYWCEMAGGAWVAVIVGKPATLLSRSRVLRLVGLARRPPPEATPRTPPG